MTILTTVPVSVCPNPAMLCRRVVLTSPVLIVLSVFGTAR